MNLKRHKTQISIITGILLSALAGSGYISHSSIKPLQDSVSHLPNDYGIVSKGKEIYTQNCASCHGPTLEGEANWRQRDTDGYMPAPPHNQNGHTWHHSDDYLFSMTKYGIEQMISEDYPNNMPAYGGKLSDDDIITVLSYIKSTWPDHIKRRHDQQNMSYITLQR
jgi:mono/diheme cytochrome c family protein